MSRLAAAALRRASTASGVTSSSIPAGFSPVSSRLFSTDASGTAAESQDDSFFKRSQEGLAYGRFYGSISRSLGNNTLKTDIIHYLDKCELSLDDVKIDYNRGYYPTSALLRFPSKESFNKAFRQIGTQGRQYKLENLNREEWDLKQSFDGKVVLLQGIPRNAQSDDIERFLSGTNFEPTPLETFLRPGVPGPIRVVLVKFRTKTDATNAFITKNRTFCLNNPVSMRVLQ